LSLIRRWAGGTTPTNVGPLDVRCRWIDVQIPASICFKCCAQPFPTFLFTSQIPSATICWCGAALVLQPPNRRCVDAKRLRNVGQRLVGIDARQCFLPLMSIQLARSGKSPSRYASWPAHRSRFPFRAGLRRFVDAGGCGSSDDYSICTGVSPTRLGRRQLCPPVTPPTAPPTTPPTGSAA
jgi:hypothetical protein